MPYNRDLRGYYSALGVSTSARPEEIKKAYRAKAQELHPDRNPASDATRKFQFLSEAFQTLSDAESRTRYDAASFSTPDRRSATGHIDPVVCSECGKVSTQPRYVIYYQVISFFLIVRRYPRGVFCSECGTDHAYKASSITAIFGWWGPLSFIWVIHALVRNMLGGRQPAVNNFKILAWQALYFASIARPDLARAVALDALQFEKRISRIQKSADAGIGQLGNAIRRLVAAVDATPVKLANVWGVGSRAFTVQAIGAGALIALIAAAILADIGFPAK
jgi:hypothetical protein